MQLDTKQHLGTASEQTQLQNFPAAPDSARRGGGTRPGHKQAKGVSETSGDLQSRVELRDYPVPPPKPPQTPMAPCSIACWPQSPSHHLPCEHLVPPPSQPSHNTTAVNLRLGPWILMGLVLMREWEQFWQTQSFPLNVTLSPMGNGFLWPTRGGEV